MGCIISRRCDAKNQDHSQIKKRAVTDVFMESVRKSSSFDSQRATAAQPGDYFGMCEFIYGCPQLQTLTTCDEVTALSVSYDEMRTVLQEHQLDPETCFSNMTRSIRRFLIRDAHPSLRSLEGDELDALLAAARTQKYERWETMIRKGQKMQNLSILELGRCIEYDGHAETLMQLEHDRVDNTEHTRPGETFGTKSMVLRKDPPAPFTIIAIEPCQVLHICKSSLEALTRFRDNLPQI